MLEGIRHPPSGQDSEMFNRLIFITGMPRSGTSWLAQIMAAHPDVRLKLCPLFSYEFRNTVDGHSDAAQWRRMFRAVYATASDYLDQEFLRRDGLVPAFPLREALPSILVIKSNRHHHLTERLVDTCPEIHWLAVVRHPCATIHSWLANPGEFPAGANPLTEWRTGMCRKTAPGEFWGFDDWKQVTTMFLDLQGRHPERFRIVRHEALVADSKQEMQRLFTWLGMESHPQVEEFLWHSQATHCDHPRSVFKSPGNTLRWRTHLPESIQSEIEHDLRASPLRPFLDRAS